MITEPGIYILKDPLRIVAAAVDPVGKMAILEYPLTPEQAAGFAVGLARASADALNQLEAFDRDFLSALKVKAN